MQFHSSKFPKICKLKTKLNSPKIPYSISKMVSLTKNISFFHKRRHKNVTRQCAKDRNSEADLFFLEQAQIFATIFFIVLGS